MSIELPTPGEGSSEVEERQISETPGQESSEVEDRHRFDEASLSRYLAKEIPDFDGSLTVKKFGSGQSNPTFFLTTDKGRKYVLRKQPPGELIRGAHAVDREFRVMRALGNAGYEVPGMHTLCLDEGVIGTMFYVMDFIQGRIVDNGLLKLPVEQRKPAMMAITRSLAKLHSYDLTALGFVNPSDPFGKVGCFYSRQIKTMMRTSEAQASKAQPLRSINALLGLFKANMPEDRSCVIHGDWKPDNIVLSADRSPRVLAVLDWELSTIGHPLSDLANMCLPFHLGELGSLIKDPADPGFGEGSLSEDEIHRVYCDAAGIAYPIANWSFFVAFSMFRLAVITQGVAMRAALGTASGMKPLQATRLAMEANRLCDSSLDIMNKAFGHTAKL